MGTSHEGPQLKLSLAFVVGLIVMVAESFIKLSYSMLTKKRHTFLTFVIINISILEKVNDRVSIM